MIFQLNPMLLSLQVGTRKDIRLLLQPFGNIFINFQKQN